MSKRVLARIIVIVTLFVWAVTATVFVGIKTSKINKLKKENIATTEEYNNFKGECEKEVVAAQLEVENRDKTITELNSQITELNTKVNNLNKQITELKKKVNNISAQKAVSGNKKTYQDYAHDLVINEYGWSENDFNALVNLWNKESNWTVTTKNKSSGAYGIPQALPASKMASCGDDYLTNYKTQIKWGLKYIKERYGTPTSAWNHFLSHHWY